MPTPLSLLCTLLPPSTGEYWDSLSYQFDGTPAHNQDAHRQRTVDWINAAGGLATAFGEWAPGAWQGVWGEREGSGHSRQGCVAWGTGPRPNCCRHLEHSRQADRSPGQHLRPMTLPLSPHHPQTSPPRASCTPCLSAASTGG